MSRSSKIGRNDPCPCRSGKKFKKCCLPKAIAAGDVPGNTKRVGMPPPIGVLREAAQMFKEKEQHEREHTRRYGRVRQHMASPAFGKQAVVVKNQVVFGDWKYFSDFLRDFVPHVFGKDWFDAEIAKPEAERHPAIQWRTQGARYMNAQPAQPDGSRVARPSGALAAYMSLAYDLFVGADNGELDDALVERLKIREQFQGARHELFAEATCLRAGFAVQHENEKDGATRHAEFMARHTLTGQLVSVEAKSRHRAGVLAMPGKRADKPDVRFGELINDAVSKKPPHPLVIFIDTNMPFKWADRFYPRQGGNIPQGLLYGMLERTKKAHNNVDPYSMIVFSNHPHHYEPDGLDPQRHLFSVVSKDAPANLVALRSLHDAANLYGNIPNEFPSKDGKKASPVEPVFTPTHTVRYDFAVDGMEVKVTRNGEPISAAFSTKDIDRAKAPSALHEFLEDIGRSRVDAYAACKVLEKGESLLGVMGTK